MAESHSYLRDGDEIYRRSFAVIRAEADLARFSPLEAQIAVRMIHACGMVDLTLDIDMSPDFADLARRRLQEGAPILCDSSMVAQGVTRSRLPADNLVSCSLAAPDVPELAKRMATTRSAAALIHWLPFLAGAVAVFGNAPTALFRLLEMMQEGAPKPAAIIGVPVGFVGAVESKQALAACGVVPFLTVHGRRGGSAMAAAAVNALASEAL